MRNPHGRLVRLEQGHRFTGGAEIEMWEFDAARDRYRNALGPHEELTSEQFAAHQAARPTPEARPGGSLTIDTIIVYLAEAGAA